jgi:hypothetical protein
VVSLNHDSISGPEKKCSFIKKKAETADREKGRVESSEEDIL